MRIGLYGMPTAGKTYILDRIDFIDVIVGSKLLREYDPDFDRRDEAGKEKDRREVAELMMKKDTFIMDGHYAFGDTVAFTEEEGRMYDVYLYLYIDPKVLRSRMEKSEKNRKYLAYDIREWQEKEITALRNYCHRNMKDFYVVDNPLDNVFEDVSVVVSFIRDIVNGYSCASFARSCADRILTSSVGDHITLMDGDRTLTVQDSSGAVFGYKTNLFDGNFYTGFQAWKQKKEFAAYDIPDLHGVPVELRASVRSRINETTFILTSGHEKVWSCIAGHLHVPFFYGPEMSAETKLYITRMLQDAGRMVTAYGDGMNDYFMLKQADEGFLVTKSDGSLSRSLRGRDTEGLLFVRD